MLPIRHQLNAGQSKVHPTTKNHMHFNWITPAVSLRLRAAAEPGTWVRRGSMSVEAPSQPQRNSARKWKTNDRSRESRRSNKAAASPQLGQTPGGCFLKETTTDSTDILIPGITTRLKRKAGSSATPGRSAVPGDHPPTAQRASARKPARF